MNMKRNNLFNWTIRPVAVSSKEGTATFFADPVCGATGTLEADRDFNGTRFRAQTVAIQAKMTTVDAEISSGAPPPQFVKIDVEGHELDVLEGARNTLSRHRPLLILETTRNHKEVAASLDTLGYQLFDLNGKRIVEPEFNTVAAPRETALFA